MINLGLICQESLFHTFLHIIHANLVCVLICWSGDTVRTVLLFCGKFSIAGMKVYNNYQIKLGCF